MKRRSWGPGHVDSGRVFTYEDGRPLRAEYPSARFDLSTSRYAAIRRRFHEEGRTVEWIARRHRVPEEAVRIALSAPLPPVRFHDLRHGAARNAARREGRDQGHLRNTRTCQHILHRRCVYVVAEELAEQAALAISAFVPRRSHQSGS